MKGNERAMAVIIELPHPLISVYTHTGLKVHDRAHCYSVHTIPA